MATTSTEAVRTGEIRTGRSGAPLLVPPRWFRGTVGRAPEPVVTIVLVLATVAMGWATRFVMDDAFISFRYAKNLAEGRGLVFNPGEYVEGYTNFLWTLLMVVPEWLDLDPVIVSQLLGTALAAGTVVVMLRFGRAVFDSVPMGQLAAAILCLNYSFIIYATGGLETQLQVLLVTASALALLPATRAQEADVPSVPRLLIASLLVALALLTRLDSAVLLAAPGLVAVWRTWTGSRSPVRLAALVAPAASILGLWMAWKLAYYGALFPNTASAKAMGWLAIPMGVAFLAAFLVFNLYVLFVPAAIVHRRVLVSSTPLRLITVSLVLWVLYLVAVGGDFMEFRFMVAALPYLAVVLASVLAATRSPQAQAALGIVVLLGLPFHAIAFQGAINVDSRSSLAGWMTGERSWVTVGRQLARDLPGGPGPGQVRIAVTAAGAVPYHSDLPSLDMLGLTDPTSVRPTLDLEQPSGIPKPGHVRIAAPAHLVDQDVDLVVGHPLVLTGPRRSYSEDDVRSIFLEAPVSIADLPDGAAIVEMPLPDGAVAAMIYLRPHPRVEELIGNGTWRRVPIAAPD